MAQIYVSPGMPIQVAINKFKKQVEIEGILKEYRKKEFFVKPSAAKKQKSIAARKLKNKKHKRFGKPKPGSKVVKKPV